MTIKSKSKRSSTEKLNSRTTIWWMKKLNENLAANKWLYLLVIDILNNTSGFSVLNFFYFLFLLLPTQKAITSHSNLQVEGKVCWSLKDNRKSIFSKEWEALDLLRLIGVWYNFYKLWILLNHTNFLPVRAFCILSLKLFSSELKLTSSNMPLLRNYFFSCFSSLNVALHFFSSFT